MLTLGLATAHLAVLLALPSVAGARDDDTALSARLTGSRALPDRGDRDGLVRADLRLLPGRICFWLRWSGLSPPTAAAVHQGVRGTAGPLVVSLFTAPGGLPPDIRAVHGCAPASGGAQAAIRTRPGAFHVVLHTGEHAAGAVRGHLFRARHAPVPPPQGLATTLTGATAGPGPGDTDGAARAHLRARGGLVCFQLRWRNLAQVTAIHVHQGGAGMVGQVVVALLVGALPATLDGASGCVTGLDRSLARSLRAHPERYSVNLHTTGHVDGAVRGQLGRG